MADHRRTALVPGVRCRPGPGHAHLRRRRSLGCCGPPRLGVRRGPAPEFAWAGSGSAKRCTFRGAGRGPTVARGPGRPGAASVTVRRRHRPGGSVAARRRPGRPRRRLARPSRGGHCRGTWGNFDPLSRIVYLALGRGSPPGETGRAQGARSGRHTGTLPGRQHQACTAATRLLHAHVSTSRSGPTYPPAHTLFDRSAQLVQQSKDPSALLPPFAAGAGPRTAWLTAPPPRAGRRTRKRRQNWPGHPELLPTQAINARRKSAASCMSHPTP